MTLHRTALLRRTPLRRRKGLRAASPEHRERRREFRNAVLVRDYLCRMCGKSQAVDAHHVRPTGRGGRDDPEQAVGLCRQCHFLIHHDAECQRRAKVEGLLA